MADWAFWLFRRKDNTELGDLRDRNRSVKYATKEGDTVTSDLATVLFAEVQSSFGASILTSIVYSLLGSDRVANSLPRPLGLPGRSRDAGVERGRPVEGLLRPPLAIPHRQMSDAIPCGVLDVSIPPTSCRGSLLRQSAFRFSRLSRQTPTPNTNLLEEGSLAPAAWHFPFPRRLHPTFITNTETSLMYYSIFNPSRPVFGDLTTVGHRAKSSACSCRFAACLLIPGGLRAASTSRGCER